jgi:CRISPR system Cascade subunit CasE
MYLSRLVLNPLSKDVWRDLGDCRKMHRTVMSGFPTVNAPNRARAILGVLYRLEMTPHEGRIIAYVQSMTEPEWAALVDKGYLLSHDACGDPEGNPSVKAIGAHYDAICTGDVLRFRILANPTVKVGTSTKADREAGLPKSNGRRVPIVVRDQQVHWLERKAEQNGFELLSATADDTIPDVAQTEMRSVHDGRWRDDQEDRITVYGVMFDGRLRVVDTLAFGSALRVGIGPAKAYGCGLLSVSRAM